MPSATVHVSEGEQSASAQEVQDYPQSDTEISQTRESERPHHFGQSEFTRLHSQWAHMNSRTVHDAPDKEEKWGRYHAVYREARKRWTNVPYHKIAQEIRAWAKQEAQPLRIGDFGCGEGLLFQELRSMADYSDVVQSFVSFDHHIPVEGSEARQARGEHLVEMDFNNRRALRPYMGNDWMDLNCAVFSLSLMSRDWASVFSDIIPALLSTSRANRIFICEATSHDSKLQRLSELLKGNRYELLTAQPETFGNPSFTLLVAQYCPLQVPRNVATHH